MDRIDTIISMIGRFFFACFLAVTIFFAMLMTGFAGDSGTNPIFIYLCLSTLFFAITGLICLCMPTTDIISGSKGSRIIFGLFLISIIQPFIVISVANLLTKADVVSNSTSPVYSTATVCVTQESNDPNTLAWIDIAIGQRAYSRITKHAPLAPGEKSCALYNLLPSDTIKLRAYTSTSANAVEYWTGPAPEDLISGELTAPVNPNEPLFISVAPIIATPNMWLSKVTTRQKQSVQLK